MSGSTKVYKNMRDGSWALDLLTAGQLVNRVCGWLQYCSIVSVVVLSCSWLVWVAGLTGLKLLHV